MKLNIAICDDNEIILNDEYNMVKSVLDEEGIASSIHKFVTPSELLKSTKKYDIFILDVEMEGMTGIETAKKLKKSNANCHMFFVTNYASYMDEALNQHAFRFWTKPLDRAKLAYGLKCAIDELHKHITVTVNNEKISVPAENIIYIYMENKRLHVITRKGEFVTKDTISSICEQLKSIPYFAETSRGYYVNYNYIDSYTHEEIICVYQEKKYKVYISRRKYKDFNISFTKWLGASK